MDSGLVLVDLMDKESMGRMKNHLITLKGRCRSKCKNIKTKRKKIPFSYIGFVLGSRVIC